jgi:hypothetical protein
MAASPGLCERHEREDTAAFAYPFQTDRDIRSRPRRNSAKKMLAEKRLKIITGLQFHEP